MMDSAFSKKVITLRGNLGKKWLEQLPNTIKWYEQKWHLKCFAPFNLSYNYVAPAETQNGESVVLKIGFPENNEFIPEIQTLQLYDGLGAIRIIQEDKENSVVLLERAVPGTRVGNVTPDREQISIVADVLKKIHKPITSQSKLTLPTLSDWAKAFDKYRAVYSPSSGPVPQWMFEQAEDMFTQYSKDKREKFLLHGDLHNDNILLSQRGWLVIDPKGIIGEREFDVGTYLRNPYADLPEGSNYKKIVTDRIFQFSDELGFDKIRIRDWAFANAVISLLWFLEDEKYVKEIYLQNAELINQITF